MKGNLKITEQIKKHWYYIVLPVLITAIMLGVYAVKGVYPFGNTRISYYDMTQDNVPGLTYLWDILHGKANVLFDWNSGAGVSWVASIAKFLLRPSNLFFYFVKREAVWESLSFFVILKMVLAALSICFCLNRSYTQVDKKWLVPLSILYAFSGYILQYYTNIFFLDFVILLPLLHMSLVTMFEKGKSRWYVLCLSYCLCLDIYFSFMMCLYLIFISFFYLMLRMDKERRSQAIGRLIRSTFVCFVCTSWSTIPSALQMTSSVRSGAAESMYITITTPFYCDAPDEKVYMLIGSEVLIALVLLCLIGRQLKNKTFWYHVLSVVVFILPIIFEAVNLVWHIGSYACFPFRFAFMLTFSALDFFAWFLSEDIIKKVTGHVALNSLFFGVSLVAVAVAVWQYAKRFVDKGIYQSEMQDSEPMHYFIIAFALLSIIWMFILIQKQSRGALYAVILVCVQAALLSYGYFAPLSLDEAGEQIVTDSYKVKSLLGEKEDNLSRIKSYSTRIPSNYPIIMNYPSLANRSYNLKQGYINALTRLGYTSNNMMAYDSGGTIFSDALLNVKKTFSSYPIDSTAYALEKKGEDFEVYDNRFTLPIGTVFSDQILMETEWQDEGKLGYQKELASCIEPDADLLEIMKLSDYCVRTVEKLPECDYLLRIPVEGKKILYFNAVDKVKASIRVNGRLVYPDSYVLGNTEKFPNKLHNGLLCLGTFEDAVVTIQIHTRARSADSFQIGQLSYDVLQQLIDQVSNHAASNIVAKGNRFSCNLDSDRDGYFLVPLEYQKGWSAKVNGVKTEITPVIQKGFIGVPVTKGENRIELCFFPSGLKEGFVLSIISILFSGMLYWLEARKKLIKRLPGFVLKAGSVLYYTVAAAAIFLVYVWPIFLDVI
ncbi:MAG: YfhO family protein [Clostridiales bacterium]|nr:YfhO family protein [Clostridiales bacterium]